MFTFKGHPTFTSEYDAKKYFEREQKYWDKGRHGMNGWYYKYLTMHKIKDRYEGVTISPKWREVDQEIIFPWLEKVIKNNELGFWATQRGAAKSTIFSFAAMETVINFPGSNVIYTAEQISTIAEWFEEKLKTTYYGLGEPFRPPMSAQWPTHSNKTMPSVQFQKVVKKDGRVKIEGSGSRIYGIDTAMRGEASKIEGAGNKLILVDEIFKHPNGKQVYSKGLANITKGQRRVGSILIGGTCTNADAKGLEAAKYFKNNADTLGIDFLFVPAYWFNEEYPIYDDDGRETGKFESVLRKDGTIDRKKAEELIKKKRLALEKLNDPTMLTNFILQYPLYDYEIFETNRDDYWEQETVQTFNEQRRIYMSAIENKEFDKIDKQAILYEHPQTKELVLSYDETLKRDRANLFILQKPNAINTYICGVDTIPGLTEAKTGSNHICLVKCVETNQYVAAQIERTKDMMQLAKRMINLQRYYNNAKALVEKNSIGAIKLAYEQEGFKHILLAKTPRWARTSGAEADFGLYVNDYNTQTLNELVRKYLNSNMGLMFFEKFFEEFLRFPAEINKLDFMAAMRMAEALSMDYKLGAESTKKKKEEPVTITYTRDAKGRNVITRVNDMIKSDGTLDLTHFFTNNIPKGKR